MLRYSGNPVLSVGMAVIVVVMVVRPVGVAEGHLCGVEFAVFVSVHLEGDSDLFLVGDALNSERLGFRARKRREQHRRQNGDDGDDHQQFN